MASPQPTTLPRPRDLDSFASTPRFDLELEFVQTLSNPLYLQHLALHHYFDDPCFLSYLSYLDYFRRPEYVKYLQYPGPTLRALELVQQEAFRREIVSPVFVERMVREGFEAAAAAAAGGSG